MYTSTKLQYGRTFLPTRDGGSECHAACTVLILFSSVDLCGDAVQFCLLGLNAQCCKVAISSHSYIYLLLGGNLGRICGGAKQLIISALGTFVGLDADELAILESASGARNARRAVGKI